jgi:hypothetical protein
MKQKRGCVKWIIAVVAALAALALIGLCAFAFLYVSQQVRAREQSVPPTVFVTAPDAGTSAPAGGYLTVAASAMGTSPITRADLWMDGELVETQNSELPEGISPFYAYFDVLMSEGPHLVFVRATNSAGSVGQSLPVSIAGGPRSEPGQTLRAITVKEGQTLEDVANSHGIEPDTLRRLNPDLGGQQPPAGSQVIVPAPPVVPPPDPAPPPAGSGSALPPAAPPAGAPSGSAAPPSGPGANVPPSVPSGGSSTVPMPDAPPLKIIPPATIPIGPNLPLVVPSFKPPASPSNLQAQVVNCMVQVQWNDNASNEQRYEVWLAGQGLPQRLVASLQPAAGGPAWFEFPAPRAGTFSVWVQAVSLGGTQPSNIASVQVESSCPNTLPTNLQVDWLDIAVRGSQDRVYCYVSLEGAPEVRLPADDSAFIGVQSGQGDVAATMSGGRKFVVPIPADGTLDIGGECWGWSGEMLSKLGSLSATTNVKDWTGTRLALTGKGFEIGYAVQETGGSDEGGELTTYGFEDPTLPSPYNLRLVDWKLSWALVPTKTLLEWDWTSNRVADGFVVSLNGKPYTVVPGFARSAEVHVGACGTDYKWQVSAIDGEAYSRPSAEYVYTTSDCQFYVDVAFKRMEFKCVDNYWFYEYCPTCDDIGIWFDIYVNNQWVGTGSENFQMVVSCGIYDMWKFYFWGDQKSAKVRVPISGSNNSINIRTTFYYINPWGEPRKFHRMSQTITRPLEQWKGYLAEYPVEKRDNGVWSKLTIFVDGVSAGSGS